MRAQGLGSCPARVLESGFPWQGLRTAASASTFMEPNNSACPCKPKVFFLKAAYLVKIVCPHHCNLCSGKPKTKPCLESNGKYEIVGFISLGKAMIQREAAFLDSSKLKSTRGNRAAAASLVWSVLTLLDLLPDVRIGPLARPGNSPLPWPRLTCTAALLPAGVQPGRCVQRGSQEGRLKKLFY